MARMHTNKERVQKQKKTIKPNAKSRDKKLTTKPIERLHEQIASLGGDSQDVELLKDVQSDASLEISEGEYDPILANDVSVFLQDLQSGKTSSDARKPSKTEKQAKVKQSVQPSFSSEKTVSRDKKEQKRSEKKKIAENSGTTEVTPSLPPIASLPKGSKLVFSPGPQWYNAVPPLSPTVSPIPVPAVTQLSSLSERAANILIRDAELYQSSAVSVGHSSSDSHFLNTILSQGTLSDRLSALTLLVQGSPVHNTKALESLKAMAERGRGKGGREEGLKAMRCIVDWWVGGGAPNRKLKYLRDQPFLLHPNVTDQHLVMWYFEDWLKKFFFNVLQILETYSLDPLQYVRTQSLAFITSLLRENPEQEQNLLRLLVNKMGDTEKSVCSRASYHLLQVLQAHPAMKAVIVRELRALIFRPTASTSVAIQEAANKAKTSTHIRFEDEDEAQKLSKKKEKGKTKAKAPTMERWNSHAWYYAAVTLNQIVLTSNDQDRETARVLIEVYFEMFREILGSTQEAPKDEGGPDDHKKEDDHKKKAKGKEKAVPGAAGFTEVEDANSRLVSAILTGVNRALPFAKVDVGGGNEIFKKHIDTLFLITHTSTFNISLQALTLILQVITTFAANASASSRSDGVAFSVSLSDRFYRTLYSSLADPRLAKSNKQAMYLNLLFKAIKVDQNLDRVKAFVRRFVQLIAAGGSGGPEFIAGGLYLLGELFATVPGLRDLLKASVSVKESEDAESYDPRKRDPQYAHASASPLFELIPLTRHYHPSVALHARQLLSSQPITASADLTLNTLTHFLDRFIYKNPKKPKAKGASAMQPAASTADGAGVVKLMKGEPLGQTGPVNEESWWKRRVEDVPVDEIFFHKYFQQKHAGDQKKKKKVKGSQGQEDEPVGEEREDEFEGDEPGQDSEDDEEETEIWKVMKATMPKELQDDDLMDDDSDDMPSDLDDDSQGGEDDKDAEENAEDEEESKDEDAEDDSFSLAEGSDAEDLIPLDGDIPDGLIEYDGSDSDGEDAVVPADEEWTGFSDTAEPLKKRKREEESKSGRRKKLKSLPTFASYEDYAKLIENGKEDNI